MSKSRRTVQRLFDMYETNLGFYFPDLKNHFLCPICHRLFSREAITLGYLTIEHIIPEQLGGKLITLTCRDCNHTSGSQLESNLVQRFRVEDALAGKFKHPLRGKVKTGEGEFAADIHISFDQLNLRMVDLPKLSNPKLHRIALEEMHSGVQEFSITANLGFNDLLASVAAVRSAYLLMFHYFGYGYILHENVNQVHSQILNPKVRTKVVGGLMLLPDIPAKNVVAILTSPEKFRCFVALLDLSTASNRYASAMLPGFDTSSKSFYDRIEESEVEGLRPELRIIPYQRSFITDPAFTGAPSVFWRIASKEWNAQRDS